MRYVAVCELGSHLQDINWQRWTHRHSDIENQRHCRDKESLFLKTLAGKGESLGSIVVRCLSCSAERNFGELSGDQGLKNDGFRCKGEQPWEYVKEPRECDSTLRAIQRGSTSIHLPELITAIDIPEVAPQSQLIADKVREHHLFSTVKSLHNTPGAGAVAGIIAEEVGAPSAVVLGLAEGGGETGLEELAANLREGEWAAFATALNGVEAQGASDFVVERADFADASVPAALHNLVESLGRAHRLREVRAMRSFKRYKQEATSVRVDLGKKRTLDWYPATEQFGEGIFVGFNEEKLRQWEECAIVQERVQGVAHRLLGTPHASKAPELSARFVMLHTLAHLLMRRLQYESGYSAASLKERIYALPGTADPQGGILIYTGAGDEQGTLGGLVRIADPDLFGALLLEAIDDGDMCSNDPVCGESYGQGMNGLNLAACHGCTLTAETACENGNILLDRRLVLGDGTFPGFFDTVLADTRSAL